MRAQIQHLPSFSPLLLSVSFSSPSPSIIKIFRSFSLSSRTSAIIHHQSIQKRRLQQQQTFITPAITRPGSYITTTATRTIRTIQRKYGVTSAAAAAAAYTKNSNCNTLRRTLVPASSTLTVPVVTPSLWRLKFESRIPSLQQYQHQQWPRPRYLSTTSASTSPSRDDDPNIEEEEQHTRDQPGEEESNTNSSLSTASAASLSSPSSSASSSSPSNSSSSSSAPILYVVTAEVHDMVQYKEWLQELEILLQDTLGIEDVKIQHFENPQSSPEYTTKTNRTSTLSTVVTTTLVGSWLSQRY